MSKKKLLIYAHYYSPDNASTGQLLQELAESLLYLFEITIICVVPSYLGTIDEKYKTKKFYFENINGVSLIRVRVPEFSKSNRISRLKNILAYFFRATQATFKVEKQDYVFSISQPPILGGLLGVFGKTVKHAKFIYNIQDFNPEQILAVNYSKNKILTNLMMFLDKWSCKKSDLIITVGRDLVKTIESRFSGKPLPKTVLINNWADEKKIFPLDSNTSEIVEFKEKYKLTNKFVFMYSGNIGLYYDLENIIKIIERFSPQERTITGKEILFAFVGSGTIQNQLQSYVDAHNMNNVVFIPYQDKDFLNYSLNSADVHWCVNAKGIKGVSCPSKAYGILAAGKPIIGVLEPDSEIRLIIEESESGLCCSPGQYDVIEKNIRWFIEHDECDQIKKMQENGRSYLEKHLTKNISIEKYANVISSL